MNKREGRYLGTFYSAAAFVNSKKEKSHWEYLIDDWIILNSTDKSVWPLCVYTQHGWVSEESTEEQRQYWVDRTTMTDEGIANRNKFDREWDE